MPRTRNAIKTVEMWDVIEIRIEGPARGNPFLEVEFVADFSFKHRTIAIDGFYGGDGVYCVRFMPDTVGRWTYVTRSNRPELDGITGAFECTKPSAGNHGPVGLRGRYHFGHADGTPHYSFGTTCYAWIHQPKALQEQTLKTLAAAPFNKLRMCVFPKHYAYNCNEPDCFVFPQKKGSRQGHWRWDFERFDTEFFADLDHRIIQLMDLGIEADLIIFHPYDRWSFANLEPAVEERFLKYLIARVAAFRNVWWSMANEWDFMKAKTEADFDRFFRVVQENDPYRRLRSVHNGHVFYDHSKRWVTHCSVQNGDLSKVTHWREQYGKPVVVDECCYEGNILQGWGNITAQEMVHRFWLGVTNGGYVGHGETYLHPKDILWWSKGGKLHGQSPRRIAFLRKILEEAPVGLEPIKFNKRSALGREGKYYLLYLSSSQMGQMNLDIPPGGRFKAEIIDTWKMTVTPVRGTVSGKYMLKLPTRPYMAVRLTKSS